MIKIFNYISASAIRLIALFSVKVSPLFSEKFSSIKQEILKVNRQQIDLPENLVSSVVKIEDKRYFQHSGIDLYSIARAIFKNVSTSRIEGASTIVQQLVRNIINEREINAGRKIKEIMLATLVDNEFSKTEIFFAYLQTYCIGNFTGVLDFCKNENYDINSLSHTESSQIAARLKYPIINKSNYIKYLKRVRTIEKTSPTGVLQKWRFNVPQTCLWLIRRWLSESTFAMKIFTFARAETFSIKQGSDTE